MAQAVNTIYVDDLDNTEIPVKQATTVAWSWRGVDYEFDTTAERLAAIETGDEAVTVAHLLKVSRLVGGRRNAARPVGASVTGTNDAAAIRSWARDNGINVPNRGRVPAPVRDSFAAAHTS